MHCLLFCSFCLFLLQNCYQPSTGDVVFETDFQNLDSTQWIVESETEIKWSDLQGENCMDIDVQKGITIWFNQKLKRDVVIEFAVTVVDEGSPNDRVSDLNCFWMASDPENPDNFFERKDWRNGVFWHYYSLNLYYVGLGGHDNSKTRFRKYHGKADPIPEVIREYTGSKNLITPNKRCTVKIVCKGNLTQYFYNGQKLFELDEENTYDSGYFGFRTVNNHMKIHSFKVFKP